MGGKISFDGRDVLALPESQMRNLRGRGMAMIFQEPQTSLNPVMTIGAQIAEALPPGLRKSQVRQEVLRLLEEVGIPEAGAAHRQLSVRIVRRSEAARHDRAGPGRQS